MTHLARKRLVWLAVPVLMVLLLVGVQQYVRVGWVDYASGTQRWESRIFGFTVNSQFRETPFSKRARSLGAVVAPPDWHVMSVKSALDHNSPTFLRAGRTVVFFNYVESEMETRELGVDDQRAAMVASLSTAIEKDRCPDVRSNDVGFEIWSSPVLAADPVPERINWKWPRK